MKTKTLRIISIFIIMVIAIGCVNKSQENGTNNITNNGTNISENQDIDKPIMITETDNNKTVFNDTNVEPKDTPEDIPIDAPAYNRPTSTTTPIPKATSIATTQTTPMATIQATPIATIQSDNISIQNSSTDNISIQNSSGLNDTSVTQTFKIGDEKNILGINIKLVNITDYNENTVILDIDGIEYKYDSDSEATIQVKGRKIIDVITSEDDQTADIAVDYS